MSESPKADTPGDSSPVDAAKTRRCLRCKTAFPSEWAGERICSRCKGTAAWRNGTPPRSHPAGGRR